MNYFLNFQDANFTTQLELAVRFGKTLIIQEVDGVEPILYPLLRGDLISQGSLMNLNNFHHSDVTQLVKKQSFAVAELIKKWRWLQINDSENLKR